jgi:hypothetical protein
VCCSRAARYAIYVIDVFTRLLSGTPRLQTSLACVTITAIIGGTLRLATESRERVVADRVCL